MSVKTFVRFGSALRLLYIQHGYKQRKKKKILTNQDGIHPQGVISIMTYTGRLRPNEVPFSGLRYMKG